MTSAEDREMMERISRLAGQINRHKSQQAGLVPTPPARPHHRTSADRPHASRAGVDTPRDAGFSSGWRRGGFPPRGGHRGARMPVYRNRTLVLNGGSQQSRSGDPDSGTASDASSSSSWVTKTDRHLQLINSSVYKRDAQARALALEQSRRQKLALRDRQERAKLASHFNRMATSGGLGPSNQQTAGHQYEITVQGLRFVVAKNGSKLVRVPGASRPPGRHFQGTHMATGDGNSAKATPKTAVIGGVKFYRSKNGNLYRHGIVKAHRYVPRQRLAGQLTPAAFGRQSGAVKKVDVPCKQFSMTGNSQFLDRCPERPRTYRASVSRARLTNRDDRFLYPRTAVPLCPRSPQSRDLQGFLAPGRLPQWRELRSLA